MRHAPDSGPLVVPGLYHRVPEPEGLVEARIGALYTVFVEELEFYGHHGVSAEEQHVGHRFTVTLSVIVDADIPRSDDVEDTVDYGHLAQIAVNIGTNQRFKTVEALAKTLCDEVLKTFSPVESVHVHLSKLLPPFPYVAKSAGVSVSASRSEVMD